MAKLGSQCGALLLSIPLLTSCATPLEITSDFMSMACDSCRKQGVPVDVLWKLPDRPYTAIARVEAGANIPDPAATWEVIKLALCREARRLDADAVLVNAWAYEGDSWTLGFVGYGGQAKQLRGLAIRYGAEETGGSAPIRDGSSLDSDEPLRSRRPK